MQPNALPRHRLTAALTDHHPSAAANPLKSISLEHPSTRTRRSIVHRTSPTLLHVDVPSFSEARVTDAKLTELVPVEYSADSIVLLTEDKPVFGVIVEAQLRLDQRKHYTWPLYSIAARARHECPFAVVVVTPDHGVERWASQPINLGDGMVFRPRVLGPDGIPKITDVNVAMQDPELAVLSAIAHGEGDVDTAVQIAAAAKAAASQLHQDRQLIYSVLVDKALSAAARKALKMLPNPQTYVDEWRRQITDEGRAEGRAEGVAKGVLTILAKRKLDVTDRQQQQITECTDLATLDRWLDMAFSVASVDELFSSVA